MFLFLDSGGINIKDMEIKSVKLIYEHGAWIGNYRPMVVFYKNKIKYILDYGGVPLDQGHYKITMEYNPNNEVVPAPDDIYFPSNSAHYQEDFRKVCDTAISLNKGNTEIMDAFPASIEIVFDNGQKRVIENLNSDSESRSPISTIYEIAKKYCPKDFRKYIYDE